MLSTSIFIPMAQSAIAPVIPTALTITKHLVDRLENAPAQVKQEALLPIFYAVVHVMQSAEDSFILQSGACKS